ncbi:hypothetical protein J5N97_005796 [Dioscorea zingiberensis]|uniref:J domain-containing protein n=1 Tax=Dioscorea zingiberensis TaxID=325984 RepID=A0A9D5D8T2_9LILI|nr:hypothetical protein J5N97_005796 [Dioscorea zingiberensis]
MASVLPFLRRYSVPLVLFSLGLFFQLVLLPSSYPPSHYDVLGVSQFASIEEVTEAYRKFSFKWDSGAIPTTAEFIDIRYSFELLTNPTWKRDYDLYGIDEQLEVIEKTKAQYDGESFSNVKLPLLDATILATADHTFDTLTPEEFASLVGNTKAVLIQVYSSGSYRWAKFLNGWKRIGSMLDGVADTGMVEVGEVQVVSFMAERRLNNQPFFRNGLPALVAFPPYCKSSDCLVRYKGDLSVDAVVDWIATSILGLPRIPYYSRDTLGPDFIGKTGLHKVKVIGFSKTGERAPPFLRQAAKEYQAYASFAFVLWRETESSIWWNTFGNLNSSYFVKLMEENKYFALPQLRSLTSMELGCDARGYSRAGNDMLAWYCVILVGRPSVELNKMRETIRRAQNLLANDANPEFAKTFSVPAQAIAALNEKRLTFVWLDGEVQKDYCLFYLHSDTIYETCGPRRDPANVPRLFIVRYKRSSKEGELNSVKPKKKNIWETFHEEDDNKASQLVAKYNGTEDLQEIILWISQIIEDGDTRNLPDFMVSTPELVPEEGDPIWSRGTHNIASSSKGIFHKFQNVIMNIPDYRTDPRLGPILLLAACLSFGAIWLQNSARPPQKMCPAEEVEGKEKPKKRRRQRETTSNQDRPPSITDAEPQDAYQILATDSDSE